MCATVRLLVICTVLLAHMAPLGSAFVPGLAQAYARMWPRLFYGLAEPTQDNLAKRTGAAELEEIFMPNAEEYEINRLARGRFGFGVGRR